MDQVPVFVYGALRRGQFNHRAIKADLRGVRKARLRGHVLYSDSGGAPWIDPCGALGPIVTGDLLLFKPDRYEQGLPLLDWLEGCPTLYVRTLVRVEFRVPCRKTWRQCDAWAYLGGDLLPRDPRRVIPSGDWVAARTAQALAGMLCA